MTDSEAPRKEGTTLNGEHYIFPQGRNMKGGTKNPGMLIINHCRTFTCARTYDVGSSFLYRCKFSRTPGIICKARASVQIIYPTGEHQPAPGEAWEASVGQGGEERIHNPNTQPYPIISKYDQDHSCEVNLPRSYAEQARHEMKEVVRRHPHLPLSDAIDSVRISWGRKIKNYENFTMLFDGE